MNAKTKKPSSTENPLPEQHFHQEDPLLEAEEERIVQEDPDVIPRNNIEETPDYEPPAPGEGP